MIRNISNLYKMTRRIIYFHVPKSTIKFFDLHEYQSKIILREYGLQVQKGDIASTPDQAYDVSKSLNGELIIKAQVQAGGRGKGKIINLFLRSLNIWIKRRCSNLKNSTISQIEN